MAQNDKAFLATLPEDVHRDVVAIRSMSSMMEKLLGTDVKGRKDLNNRIAQAMGRLAAWEDANPTEARRFAAAFAEVVD